MLYRYAWGNNPKRAMMKGRLCAVEARGTMGSILIRFVDNGERCVVSRRSIRRARPKCADLSDGEVLAVVAGIVVRRGTSTCSTFDLLIAYPEIPRKVLASKLARLLHRGFLEGCACGCRGDWEPTLAGRLALDLDARAAERVEYRHRCGFCGAVRGEGDDACIAGLPGVWVACCGHEGPEYDSCYVGFCDEGYGSLLLYGNAARGAMTMFDRVLPPKHPDSVSPVNPVVTAASAGGYPWPPDRF